MVHLTPHLEMVNRLPNTWTQHIDRTDVDQYLCHTLHLGSLFGVACKQYAIVRCVCHSEKKKPKWKMDSTSEWSENM